ncbi:MAG: DUF6544 family protein [Actinomycetota bacterium]
MEIIFLILVILEILLLFVAYSIFMFGRRIRREIGQVLGNQDKKERKVIEKNSVERLPAPVKRYLEYALNGRKEYIRTAKVRQSGYIRRKGSSRWLSFNAVQYFNGYKPSFIWVANTKVPPLAWVAARDMYFEGKGSMLVKLWSAFTITNFSGKEANISSFIRYVSEMPWLPTALLPSSYLKWEPVDNNSARAIISDGKNEAKITFTFNSRGEIAKVSTFDRFREEGGRHYKEKWSGFFRNYREVEGIKVPAELEAKWGSNFKYIKIKAEAIKYS